MAAIEATCPVPSNVLTGAWQQTKAPQQVFTSWNVNRVGCFDAHRTKCPYSAEVTMHNANASLQKLDCHEALIMSRRHNSQQPVLFITAVHHSHELFMPVSFQRRFTDAALTSCEKNHACSSHAKKSHMSSSFRSPPQVFMFVINICIYIYVSLYIYLYIYNFQGFWNETAVKF